MVHVGRIVRERVIVVILNLGSMLRSLLGIVLTLDLHYLHHSDQVRHLGLHRDYLILKILNLRV